MVNIKSACAGFGLLILSSSTAAVFAQAAGLPDAAINRPSQPIKGQYIVVFKNAVADVDREVANLNRGQSMRVLHVYKDAIKGFAAQIPDVVVNALKRNPNVSYVEQDMTVSVNDTGFKSPTTWGLARIDQLARPLDDSYIFGTTGKNVTAYVIDTGILANHDDFGGRVVAGYDAIGGGTTDCNGHGTHVAGTIGGTKWGVAKDVTLVPVRVLDCSGSGYWSGVIAGIDWVVSNHATNAPAVANMSLGGGYSQSINDAVTRGVNDGVVFAVAAGNSNANACYYSPASTPAAITVGATTSSDARANYSNYGSCLDIFAPGTNITSDWYTSTTATNTISGTSMASPHVAGVAALILETATDRSPAAVTTTLLGLSSVNVVSSAGAYSPNKLLQVPASAVAPPRVTMSSISSLTSVSATANASIRSAGSNKPVYYGVCYTTILGVEPVYPGINDVKCRPVTEPSTNTSSFPFNYSVGLSGLTTKTKYYIRPYARNAVGVTYGVLSSFTTP